MLTIFQLRSTRVLHHCLWQTLNWQSQQHSSNQCKRCKTMNPPHCQRNHQEIRRFWAISLKTVYFSWAIQTTTQNTTNTLRLILATAAKPAPEVEKLDENIAARLLNYDVDKAAEQLHSQMDEFMKELDGMADTEHNAAHDMDIDTSIQ